MIAYPDLLAPPVRRAALWQHPSMMERPSAMLERPSTMLERPSAMLDRRAAMFAAQSDSRAEPEVDYGAEQMVLDPAYLDPFQFNFHNNMERNFFDGHSIRVRALIDSLI